MRTRFISSPPSIVRSLTWWIGCLSAMLLASTAALPAAEASRDLNLNPGWNPVWIDVSPFITDGDDAGEASPVETVFTNSAITVVARPVNPVGTTEFISEPEDFFNQEGWLVWHRESGSGNTLKNVFDEKINLRHMPEGGSRISIGLASVNHCNNWPVLRLP